MESVYIDVNKLLNYFNKIDLFIVRKKNKLFNTIWEKLDKIYFEYLNFKFYSTNSDKWLYINSKYLFCNLY